MTAPQVHSKRAAAVRNVAVDFSGQLDTGELLTGAPTVTASPTGLTIDDEAVSGSALTILGVSVAAGQAIQFSVAGGTAGRTYTISVTCGTTASPDQLLVEDLTLQVD